MTQLRTLHSLTVMNCINLVCMLCFVGIYMYALASDGRQFDVVNRVGPNMRALREDDGHEWRQTPVLGLNVMITAMTYQLILLEIISEMKDPREFPKANYWCTPVVLFVGVGCAAFRYYFQGEEVDLTLYKPFEIISSTLDGIPPALGYFGMTCFTVHLLGSSLIRSVVLTRSVQFLIHPKGAYERTWRSRLEWAGISILVLVFVWMLGLAGSLNSMMSLVSGILCILFAIMLPVVLFILCQKQASRLKNVPWYEWVLIAGILIGSVVIGKCQLLHSTHVYTNHLFSCHLHI